MLNAKQQDYSTCREFLLRLCVCKKSVHSCFKARQTSHTCCVSWFTHFLFLFTLLFCPIFWQTVTSTSLMSTPWTPSLQPPLRNILISVHQDEKQPPPPPPPSFTSPCPPPPSRPPSEPINNFMWLTQQLPGDHLTLLVPVGPQPTCEVHLKAALSHRSEFKMALGSVCRRHVVPP